MQNTFSFSSNKYKEDQEYYNNHIESIRFDIVQKLVGRDKKVLDVGCYTGEFSVMFKNNNNNVFGIDASSSAVESARKKGILATVGNLEERFCFDDNSFDVVFAGEIIEHILDTDFFISEIKRVLKPGGELIITTPNSASLARRLMLLLGLNPFFEASFSFPINPKPAGHIRFFTKKLLLDFLEYHDFYCAFYCYDVVNFPFNISSRLLAKISPSIGKSLIVKFINNKEI